MSIIDLRVQLQDLCNESLETLDIFKRQASDFRDLWEELNKLNEEDDEYAVIRTPALLALKKNQTLLENKTTELDQVITALFGLSTSLLRADQNRLNK